MFVIYGAITNVSIGALFLGGVIPGLLMGLYLMIAAYVISKRRGYPKMVTPSWREVIRITIDALPALVMPVLVLGGIVGGVFTPTEAGAVAAVFCFLISTCVYRSLKLSEVPELLLQTGILTAAIMLIVSAASLIGWIFARERVPDLLVVSFMNWTSSPICLPRLHQHLPVAARLLLRGGVAAHSRHTGDHAARIQLRHRPGAFRRHDVS